MVRLLEALPEPVRRLWQRTEPFHGVVFFASGTTWDALTLTRIDALVDNLLLALYLLLLAGILVLRRQVERRPDVWPRLAQRQRVLDFASQFLFGGLFSAYVMFYTKSVAGARALTFVGVLVALLLANEFLSARLLGRRVRLALFTLCALSLFLFFIPVVSGWVGGGLFTLATLATFAVTAVVIGLGEAGGTQPGELRRASLGAGATVVSTVAGVALLYALGAIPPVPLALLDGGIYHDVRPGPQGYEASRREARSWWPWRRVPTLVLAPGDRVWCVSSVFAPRRTALEVVHRWERWVDGDWQHAEDLSFEVVGGRGQGYRGTTRKRHLEGSDLWRVRVYSAAGRELGRYPFRLQREGEGREVRHLIP